MTITGTQIYWLTRVGQIRTLSTGVMICSGLVSAVAILTLIIPATESDISVAKSAWHVLRWFGTTWLISSIFFVFTPTTKEACAMLVVPPIVNNEKVQDVPLNVLDLVSEWIEKVRPESLLQKGLEND